MELIPKVLYLVQNRRFLLMKYNDFGLIKILRARVSHSSQLVVVFISSF